MLCQKSRDIEKTAYTVNPLKREHYAKNEKDFGSCYCRIW